MKKNWKFKKMPDFWHDIITFIVYLEGNDSPELGGYWSYDFISEGQGQGYFYIFVLIIKGVSDNDVGFFLVIFVQVPS